MSVTDHDRVATVQHATLVFEREIVAPVTAVFEAYASATQRARWGAPSDSAVVLYDAENFREGGTDRYRCGSRQDPNIHVMTHYLEIVELKRIVFSETITAEGHRLCASLTTVELAPFERGTRLKNTIQVASFIGAAMIDGHKAGQGASLDNLARYFKGQDVA